MQYKDAKWIWNAPSSFSENQFVLFRKKFDYAGGEAALHITADSRYYAYLNGAYLGFGPVRAYPDHYKKDVYDVTSRLRRGKNELVVLVNHFGCDTFQYIKRDGGLLAWLEADSEILFVTDSSWDAAVCREYAAKTPRISCQQQYEEQVDGRLYNGWREGKLRGKMHPAAELRPFEDGLHKDLRERGIPFLTQNILHPRRLCELRKITGKNAQFCLDYGKFLPETDFASTPWVMQAGFVFFVRAKRTTECSLVYSEWFYADLSVNGQKLTDGKATFRKGLNTVFLREAGAMHSSVVSLSFTDEAGLTAEKAYLIGPFAPKDDNGAEITGDALGYYHTFAGEDCPPEQRKSYYGSAASGDLSSLPERFVRDISDSLIPENVFLRCYHERGEETGDAEQKLQIAEALVSGGEFTLECNGQDTALLLDFGTEAIGFLEFECFAERGTIIDFHNFEFIQPDGRKNYAEGMNNTCRYIARAGAQTFRSIIRRGLRYSYLTVRNCDRIRLKNIRLEVCTYPQAGRGSFFCDDWKLNTIYEVGKKTLRNCSEDTFTDCPTYEQVHWVGDMRNEALIHWVLNGDKRLWFRCLDQVGQSLEYSDITQSQVPSGWYNILPCWSFLWMRSIAEYYRYTGDADGTQTLIGYLKKNIDGIERHVNADGLFEIVGWNMFDWANMDTPSDGVITHLNCFAVLALQESRALLQKFCDPYAEKCAILAQKLTAAVNTCLWNDERQAYTDCLRYRGGERVQSKVFSQQTQTMAYMSGVAEGERAARAAFLMENPEKDFVVAGSPFFEFFYLEAMIRADNQTAFIEDVRKSWGRMIDTGCDNFWEMWTYIGPDGRLTRSHCHGWSAAPVYFLTEYVLGVTPAEAGYKKVRIQPHPCGLHWCRGTVPTPYGDILVQWNTEGGKLQLTYTLPEGVELA